MYGSLRPSLNFWSNSNWIPLFRLCARFFKTRSARESRERFSFSRVKENPLSSRHGELLFEGISEAESSTYGRARNSGRPATLILFTRTFFFFLLAATEELGSSMSTTLPSAPTELSQFPKLCELRRKFPVLYRVEFQVRTINSILHLTQALFLPSLRPLPRWFDVFTSLVSLAFNNNFQLATTADETSSSSSSFLLQAVEWKRESFERILKEYDFSFSFFFVFSFEKDSRCFSNERLAREVNFLPFL